jgi:hypothetical protein
MGAARPVATNLAGVVEAPELGNQPYLVDRDGRPYVPVATAGVVLGLFLGDGVFGHDADHAAPGVTLVHPDPAARHALTAFACLGNPVQVRSGGAAGATGRVLGKRGEAGRVIAVFEQDVLARMAPGDTVMVRGNGQGATLRDPFAEAGVVLMNVDPAFLPNLPITPKGDVLRVGVRGRVPSALAGNGVGRPAHMWDIDLQVDAAAARAYGLSGMALGDLVCIDDLDVRHNVGYRKGWCTVGTVVHGGSPLPGHGPGVMPLLTGPARVFDIESQPDDHVGVTGEHLTRRTTGASDG